MTKPLISIIIPTYNAEKYIARAIESAINQTFKNIEILIVDDRGQDRSIEIAQSYALSDPRVRIHANAKNLRLLHARAQGAMACNSPWLLFLDADDFLAPEACEVLVNALLKAENQGENKEVKTNLDCHALGAYDDGGNLDCHAGGRPLAMTEKLRDSGATLQTAARSSSQDRASTSSLRGEEGAIHTENSALCSLSFAPRIDMLAFNMNFQYHANDEYQIFGPIKHDFSTDKEGFLKLLLESGIYYYWNMVTKMYRKELYLSAYERFLKNVGNIQMAEDLLNFAACLALSKRIVCVQDALYYYFFNPASTMNTPKKEVIEKNKADLEFVAKEILNIAAHQGELFKTWARLCADTMEFNAFKETYKLKSKSKSKLKRNFYAFWLWCKNYARGLKEQRVLKEHLLEFKAMKG